MNKRKYWSPFFWGTFIYAFLAQLISVAVFDKFGYDGHSNFKELEKAIFLIIFLVMWSYAFFRTFSASSNIKKIILLLLSILLVFLSGYLFYIYDLIKERKAE